MQEKFDELRKRYEETAALGSARAVLAWLRERIHRHGAMYLPDDLLRRATGKERETAPFLSYIKRKYSALYVF